MKARVALVCVAAIVGAVLMAGCANLFATQKLPPYDLAWNLQKKSDFAGAIKAYNDFTKDPANKNDSFFLPRAQYNIAWCYWGMGDKDKAMEAFKEVVKQYPASEQRKWAEMDMARLEKLEPPAPKPTPPAAKPAPAARPAPKK